MCTVASGAEQAVTLTVENDSFLTTDRHYTHGTRLSYLHARGWEPVANFLNRFPRGGLENLEKTGLGLALGQNIYTPAEIEIPSLIPDDRPYAGWMYAGLIFQRVGTRGDIAINDYVELDLGIVGPEAFGREAQTRWHEIVKARRPRGWDHQLDTEPAINLHMQRSWRFRADVDQKGWGTDLVPVLGTTVGNIAVFGTVGSQIRFGYNLPGTVFTSTTLPPLFLEPRKKWGTYLFGDIEGKAVARNIFVDGNTFTSSHGVNGTMFVGEFRIGATYYRSWFEMTAMYVFRTKEFETQANADEYISIAFGARF